MSTTPILIVHAVVGWTLCGATISIARNITTLRNALIIHAVATPIIFAIVSSVYFGLFGGIRPAATAAIFVVIVVSLGALVIAPQKSFDISPGNSGAASELAEAWLRSLAPSRHSAPTSQCFGCGPCQQARADRLDRPYTRAQL